MTKRFFALLLCLVLCISLFPTAAFAEEEFAEAQFADLEEELPAEFEEATDENIEAEEVPTEESYTEETAEEIPVEAVESPEDESAILHIEEEFREEEKILFANLDDTDDPFVAVEADDSQGVLASGECGIDGDNIIWTLYENGDLHLSGYGQMAVWSLTNPWKSYSLLIKNVIIDYGITEIGNCAFYNIDKIVSISIPSSVTRIGDRAFWCCSSLPSINLPKSLEKIGNYAFTYCESLKNVFFEGSKEQRDWLISLNYRYDKWGWSSNNNNTFYNASWHYGESLPGMIAAGVCGEQVNNISWTLDGSGVLTFSGTGKMKDYSANTYSGSDAIWTKEHEKILKVVIEEGITNIGSGVFWSCENLEAVTIPKSLTSIGEQSFRSCVSLSSITFPGNMPSISENSFFNVTATIYYPAGNSTYTSDKMLDYGGTLTWEAYCAAHISGEPVHENEVSATCTTAGSYDEVVYCTVCGEELIREAKTIPMLGHSYELVGWLWNDYASATATFICSHDSSHIERITAESESVRTEPTCIVEGKETYTVTIVFEDDTYSDSRTIVLPKSVHIHSEPVHEKEVPATCTEAGNYDEVVYCSVCGEELTRETKMIPALNHAYTLTGWTWDGYESATATFTCDNDASHVQMIEADITSERTEASFGVDGSVVYTAAVEFEGKPYTDTKTEVLPALKPGWQQIDGKWYYINADGTPKTGWLKSGNSWFYLDPNTGVMATGWVKVGSTWYYLKDSGAMATGWQKVGSTWYYFESSGAMKTGWLKSGSTWYYLKSSGAMAVGWQKVGSTWYYFQSSGAMKTGWLKDGGKWYYLDSSGAMLANTSRNIGGKVYYFNASGVCTNP